MKKFFKKLGLFVILFLVVMYFIGSCTERMPVTNNGSQRTFTDVTPDEYERLINESINSTSLSFSPALTANASGLVTLDEWYEKTNLYDIYDFVGGYFDYLKNPDYYPEDDVNIPPPVNKSNSDSPVTTVVIPYHYNCYGKERVNYSNDIYEIIISRFDADLSINGASAKGHITFTRNSSNGYSTSFGFDIKLTAVNQLFNSTAGFNFVYTVLDTNVTGIDKTSTQWSNIKGKIMRIYFDSSLTNDIHTTTVAGSNVIPVGDIVSSNTVISSKNRFTVSQTFSNDYSFNTALNSYQGSTRTKSVNIYYNNHAMDVVTTNNYNTYADYGYAYNNITGSLELNPDIIASYFNTSIKPQLDLNFDNIFSQMPDIDATIENYTGEINNLVEIIQQSTITATTASNYPPVVTGDINVNVEITFPEEYYRQYPALTTTPAFVAETPDVDFALDAPLPIRALQVAGGLITLSSSFIDDVGLMPIVLMSVSLGLVVMFFL